MFVLCDLSTTTTYLICVYLKISIGDMLVYPDTARGGGAINNTLFIHEMAFFLFAMNIFIVAGERLLQGKFPQFFHENPHFCNFMTLVAAVFSIATSLYASYLQHIGETELSWRNSIDVIHLEQRGGPAAVGMNLLQFSGIFVSLDIPRDLEGVNCRVLERLQRLDKKFLVCIRCVTCELEPSSFEQMSPNINLQMLLLTIQINKKTYIAGRGEHLELRYQVLIPFLRSVEPFQCAQTYYYNVALFRYLLGSVICRFLAFSCIVTLVLGTSIEPEMFGWLSFAYHNVRLIFMEM